ncbi:endonuclease/exonuclease/phosphatase family protein [Maribellus sp. YY47]|uniref:endonuclease/exonuclease/phosphatase family protein n=1 Tax=Maribellus sp. YY47 TaxID=2929486 RepID=UPI002001634C|nr:endonuclease/exonuclease/phosphatase family protein [Maribellus sp. YY47]MCK3685137.1 endonuclease/exonuclease/phosphatase family protein [Maribellus sp. YY47]
MYNNNLKTTTRRSFIRQSALGVAGISTLGLLACERSSKDGNELKFIAYNVLKCTGWPAKNVKEGVLIPDLIAQELEKYAPDVINFSESPDESVVKHIADLLQMNYVFFPSAGNWPGAIITPFEIDTSENIPIVNGSRPDDLFTRHWGKAAIKISDQKSILVNSVHLYPHDNPVSAEIRKREISEILKSVENDSKNYESVIVMGDLNHTPNTPEYSQWMNAGFTDSFIAAGTGDGLTIRADKPTKRFDYILAKGKLANQVLESRPLFEGGFRTNPADPESYALSDHLPQLAKFSVK